MRNRVDPASLRAAWWAYQALHRTRRELRTGPVRSVAVSPPPRLPARAGRGVKAVLRRTDPTCLERALVLQAWEQAHGGGRDVIIGVRGSGDELAAHAWLEGDRDGDVWSFEELLRVPGR